MTTSVQLPEQLADPEFHAGGDAHVLWRAMRESARLHWHAPGELPGFWSVTRYEDARAVYRHPGAFSSAHGVLLRAAALGDDPGGGLTLALTDPPRHRKLRSLLAERFKARSARELEDAMRADVRTALAAAIERGGCDFAQDVAAWLSTSLICRLMAIPQSDVESVHRWTHEAFEAHKPLAMHLPMMRYFIDLMYECQASPADDVAARLATAVVDGEPLSESEILLGFENMVGATENAGLSMAGGMLAFLEHPDEWRRLRDERALLPTAVEEVLRYTSSATHSMRTATGPCVLAGQPIEAGDRVVVWIPSANRDETVFQEPDRFDIGRRPNRHIAFGFGEHACIGASMARVQLAVLLSELIDTAGEFEQTGPAVPLRSIAVRGPARLPVRIHPRRRPSR